MVEEIQVSIEKGVWFSWIFCLLDWKTGVLGNWEIRELVYWLTGELVS